MINFSLPSPCVSVMTYSPYPSWVAAARPRGWRSPLPVCGATRPPGGSNSSIVCFLSSGLMNCMRKKPSTRVTTIVGRFGKLMSVFLEVVQTTKHIQAALWQQA